ncbi:MAG: ABC transporter ATP-binding protein [Bacteroidales bacterium]|nr:ABC transporter ATP-binding protein [Bacteroidales bacterium]
MSTSNNVKVHFKLSYIFRALKIVWDCSKPLAIANALSVILSALLPLLTLWVMGRLVDESLSAFSADGAAFENPSVRYWLILLGLALFFEAVMMSLTNRLSDVLAERLRLTVANLLHSQMLSVSYQTLLDPAFLTDTFRATSGSTERPIRVFLSTIQLVQTVLTLFAMCIMLCGVEWWLPFVVVAAGLPLVVARLFGSSMAFSHSQSRAADERRENYCNSVLVGQHFAPEVRLFGLQSYFSSLFDAIYLRLSRERIAVGRRNEILHDSCLLISIALIVCVCYYVVTRVGVGTLSVGSLAMYLMAVRRCERGVRDTASRFALLHSNSLYIASFFAFLDAPRALSESRREMFPADYDSVSLSGVSFSYPNSRRHALTDFSIRVTRGEVVALRGSNGSGKSTVVKLLCGLLLPEKGNVRIGNTDVGAISESELSAHVCAVFQDFRLYCVSAADNIWFGDTSRPKDMDRIVEAAKDADIDALFSRLPNGYDTILGNQFEGSEMFSRGEWQKIAIARVMYSDADIILLDEPASSLDELARETLKKCVAKLKSRGKTIILVTHHSATAELADRIVWMPEKK